MDYELIFWVCAGIASLIGLAACWVLGKRESANYIEWVVE